MDKGFKTLLLRSVLQLVRRPIYWTAIFVLPLFSIFFLTDLMKEGLPVRVPAAIVDTDCSQMSQSVKQTLSDMQMVSIVEEFDNYSDARRAMQSGEVFGIFVIPDNFQSELLAGRSPEISFHTNMTFYVPASLLFKTFKTTAVYTKAGVATKKLESGGVPQSSIGALLQPININVRGLGNPQLNYAIYMCNSFLPAVMQLMIFLVTCFSICREFKTGQSVEWLQLAGGSVVKAVTGKLLPQTIIWWILMLFLEGWLFGFCQFPIGGSLFWFTLSELMFVVAAQGFALFVSSLLCNLRMAMSVCSLFGVLTFSVAAFSFPYESMYGPLSVFSWILPTRYNFLIYIDLALNGADVYYCRFYFIAYLLFILLPLTTLWRFKKMMPHPAYVP